MDIKNTATALFVLIFLALAVYAVVASGFVISILWGWFVVPLFGLPALSIPHAIGITLIISMARAPQHQDKGSGESFSTKLSALFIAPWMALLIGWITKGFI